MVFDFVEVERQIATQKRLAMTDSMQIAAQRRLAMTEKSVTSAPRFWQGI